MASRLLRLPAVSSPTEKLLQILEGRFGVRPALSRPLEALLERAASEEWPAGAWDALLCGLAEAFRSGHDAGTEARDEVHVLAGELGVELRKIDESLKVLLVYLERIRAQLRPPAPRLLQ